MLLMKIQLDTDKMQAEKRYNVQAVRRTIESAFSQMGLITAEDPDALVYRGSGNPRDYGRFGKIVNTFKRQPWFMENVTQWLLYDSDDADDPEDYNVEDLLLHYRGKHRLGA